MKQYLDILQKIVDEGKWKNNRTGIDTLSITGAMFEHDMRDGFPLLTTKKMGLKNIATELEFFIKGMSDKTWLQERGCHIWDEWCNPQKVPYGNDVETKAKMKAETDLGRVYGVQWRSWADDRVVPPPYGQGEGTIVPNPIDQLKNVIEKLKTNPTDRRMIVMAWNPAEIDQMALPPCHYGFQILSDGEHVDLLWNQRSNDFPIGNPYNIASYGLLLLLIARTVNMIPRKLIGFFADVHIYENQVNGVMEQLKREPMKLPTVELNDDFTDLFNWERDQFTLKNYECYDKIEFPIAV